MRNRIRKTRAIKMHKSRKKFQKATQASNRGRKMRRNPTLPAPPLSLRRYRTPSCFYPPPASGRGHITPEPTRSIWRDAAAPVSLDKENGCGERCIPRGGGQYCEVADLGSTKTCCVSRARFFDRKYALNSSATLSSNNTNLSFRYLARSVNQSVMIAKSDNNCHVVFEDERSWYRQIWRENEVDDPGFAKLKRAATW